MPLGTSIFLIAVGAILRYAVTATVSGIDITTVGLILMIVGVVGLLLSVLYMLAWAPRRGPVVRTQSSNATPTTTFPALLGRAGAPGARPRGRVERRSRRGSPARLGLPSSAASEQIEIEPGTLAERIGDEPGVQLVDVREAYEHEAGHIPEDRHIQLIELSSQADTLEPGRAVVFYCRTGSRSLMAAQAFRASGFEAYSMAGGLLRWAQEGRVLAPEGGEVADH